MANIAEDFVLKFHSLEGVTIAQRRKNFFVLLHQNASLKSNTQVLDTITANLIPKTFLESLLRLDFLIYYRRVQELQQLLKEGNDVFVSKIAKQIWFFKAAFNEVGADQLVNEILPCMSYSVRKKVLTKLSKFLNSDEQFDKIFDAVVARYGIFLASQYITGCSTVKIRQIILEYPVQLTTPQLKMLYVKDVSLIEYYFDNTNNSISSDTYKHFIRFLYCKNQALFYSLQKKYCFNMSFGHRLTKKFITVEKDAVIKNPSKFDYLRLKTVIRRFGKSSINLFCNWLPPLIINEQYYIQNILDNFPKKFHYNLYVKVVEDHYNTTYAQNPDLIDEFLLKLISDNSERAALAKIKVDKGCDDYIKYLTTQDSIPLIKEKINLTSDIYERGKLVKYLIQTCHINKDIEALTQVIKYFCFRHKNDEINVHMQFIQKIENLFGFRNFTEEMWNYFNDLLTIHMLKYDELSTYQKIHTLPLIKFNKGTSNYQKLSYLYFLFRKNEPIDELLLEYLDVSSEFPEWGKYSKDFEKYFLLFVIDTHSRKNLTNEQMKDNCCLLRYLYYWNGYYKDHQLSFYDFPVLVQSFDYEIRNANYVNGYVKDALKSKIFTTTSNSYRDTYLQVYWDRLSIFFNLQDFHWFIKYDPLILVNNFEKFVNQIIDTDSHFFQLKIWYKVKKFSHLQLDKNSIQFCLSKLRDEKCLDFKPKYVVCLSVAMKPEDFVVVADSFKPANKTLNLNDETEIKLYNLQCAIAQNFKNTKSYEVLSSLLHYCAGDYFKYSLRSLYSILYHTPEIMLPQYLNHLTTKAVSVRKHAFFLTCELSTVSSVENILTLLSKTEGVQSLQKQIFTATIQYFIKNPADNFFEMVKSNMLNISKSDDESLTCIVDSASKISTKYRCAYIQYSWEYLEKVVDVWIKLYPLKKSLIPEMNLEIKQQLPLEFALGILQQHFLVNDKCLDFDELISFAFYFLSCREEKAFILETILNLLDQRAERKVAFRFFYDWQYKILSSKEEDLKYLEPFVKYFENKIDVLDDFMDYIKIFFLKEKIFNSEDLCSSIFTFYDDLVSTYGPYIVQLFSSELSDAIAYFTNETETVFHYYHKLVEEHPIPIIAILLLNVIYEPDEDNVSDTSFFYQILQLIERMTDLGVQINLRIKFSKFILKIKNDYQSDMEVDK